MEDPGKDIVARVLGELLRAPEPVRDIEVDRALTRLQAARSDTPYLLLHRLLVLETALLQLRQREAALADAAPATPAALSATAARTGMAAAAPPTRSFLRDAAVVTLGVVAGQAVWGSLSTEADGALGELGDLGDLGDLLG